MGHRNPTRRGTHRRSHRGGDVGGRSGSGRWLTRPVDAAAHAGSRVWSINGESFPADPNRHGGRHAAGYPSSTARHTYRGHIMRSAGAGWDLQASAGDRATDTEA
jgi:hypothetical protein